MLDREWAVEVYIQHADFFAVGIERIGDVLADVGDRADRDDDAVSIGCAVVVEEMVASAGDLGDLIHVALNDVREGIVEGVRCFAVLEVNVRVFCGAADDRMIRIESAGSEVRKGFLVDERSELFIAHDLDLLDLMARAEAVEEIDERYAAFDGSKMGNACEVHDLLGIRFCQHRAARRTRTHDVLMVTEDGECVVCKSSRCDVENAREQFACDFVHVRYHEQHALRCRIGGSQRTALQRAMECAGCAAFCLHFDDVYGVTENILLAVSGPFIHFFRHRRGRGDRINSSYFCECVGNIRSSCVAIHCFYISHRSTLLYMENLFKGSRGDEG